MRAGQDLVRRADHSLRFDPRHRARRSVDTGHVAMASATTIANVAIANAASTASNLPAPRLVRQRERFAVGYCAATAEFVLNAAQGGDCASGSKGSWALPPFAKRDFASARAACVTHCNACARCAVVSYSPKWGDCSWFSSCDLSALRRDVEGFRTVRVRVAPAPRVHDPPTIKAWRVAVCMAGHPRALTRRHVYESIAHNLLGGLRAQGAHVDLFALLKRGDAPGKSQRESSRAIRSHELQVTSGLRIARPKAPVTVTHNASHNGPNRRSGLELRSYGGGRGRNVEGALLPAAALRSALAPPLAVVGGLAPSMPTCQEPGASDFATCAICHMPPAD